MVIKTKNIQKTAMKIPKWQPQLLFKLHVNKWLHYMLMVKINENKK